LEINFVLKETLICQRYLGHLCKILIFLSVPTADHHSACDDQRGRRLDHAAAGPDADTTAGPTAAAGAGAGGAGQHAAHDYHPIEHGGGGVATAAAPAAATDSGPTQAGSDPAAAFGHLHPQHTIVANTTATQQPKLSQVLMQPAGAVAGGVSALNVSPTSGKNKTIILTQKGVILRNIGGDMYQQIPISNVGNLQGLGGTTLMTTTAGPPSLVKTTPSTGVQLQQQQPGKQILPTLIPTSSLGGQHVIVQQQQPTNVIGNVSVIAEYVFGKNIEFGDQFRSEGNPYLSEIFRTLV